LCSIASPLDVELDRLFVEEHVDVGIAAVDISAALRDECFKARDSVVERAAGALDEFLKLFSSIP
jgi:hypothetical protein